jgi:8-oxo-dGTP diphosphatase
MKEGYSYNIRGYALLVEDNKVLVSDEYRMNMLITKFPGGGLEFGEGLVDCVQRECMEELGQEVEVLKHFYTTDFYITSAFSDTQQLISVYYLVRSKGPLQMKISEARFDFEKLDGAQSFRWIPLDQLREEDFTFAVDKKVSVLLTQHFKK